MGKKPSEELMELVEDTIEEVDNAASAFKHGDTREQNASLKIVAENKAKLQAIADSIPVWISVEDRKPEDGVQYWVFTGEGMKNMTLAFYVKRAGWFEELPFKRHIVGVTEYYPLPSPPVVKEK